MAASVPIRPMHGLESWNAIHFSGRPPACLGNLETGRGATAQEFNILDKKNRPEVYYIVTRAWVCVREAHRDVVNAPANFCFLTKDTNLDISDRLPNGSVPELATIRPGAPVFSGSRWAPLCGGPASSAIYSKRAKRSDGREEPETSDPVSGRPLPGGSGQHGLAVIARS